jgi:hypothetical protein
VSDPTEAKASALAIEKALRSIFLKNCGIPQRMAA